MASNKQSGFSAVLSIVAVVLIIGVAGLIGWRLYSQHTNTTTNDATYKESTNPTTEITQPTYLDIKELGVKIQLDDSIKDAIYTYHISLDGSPFVRLSTQSLMDMSHGTCSPDNGGLVNIGEATGDATKLFLHPVTVDNTTMFKFDPETYVYIAGRQATCSTDADIESLSNVQEKAFFKAFKTLQPDQPNSYLTIKELGIKVPLSVGIHDLTYVYSKPSEQTSLLHFSTNAIKTADPTCDENSDPMGSYTVYTSEQTNPGIGDNQVGAYVAHVNGYYIYSHEPQQPCGNGTASNLAVSLMKTLLTAVQNAQIQ